MRSLVAAPETTRMFCHIAPRRSREVVAPPCAEVAVATKASAIPRRKSRQHQRQNVSKVARIHRRHVQSIHGPRVFQAAVPLFASPPLFDGVRQYNCISRIHEAFDCFGHLFNDMRRFLSCTSCCRRRLGDILEDETVNSIASLPLLYRSCARRHPVPNAIWPFQLVSASPIASDITWLCA